MLDVINRYAHGFVLAPIVQACQRHRVFAILEDKPLTAVALVEATGANSGCLAAALRSLKSIGWLEEAGDGRLHPGGRAEQRIHIPEFANEFLTTPIAEAL